MHEISKSNLRKIANRWELGGLIWDELASSKRCFGLLGTSRARLDGWNTLKLAAIWNSNFKSFEKKFARIRVMLWARVSCCLWYSLLGIYRRVGERKNQGKRLDHQCAFIFFQIKSNIGKNLIFPSMQRLARIWQLLWAFLDSKHDIKSFLLKKYFIFIFYII